MGGVVAGGNAEETALSFRQNAQNNAQLKKRNHLHKLAADKMNLYERLSQPRRRNPQGAAGTLPTQENTNGSKEGSVENQNPNIRKTSFNQASGKTKNGNVQRKAYVIGSSNNNVPTTLLR